MPARSLAFVHCPDIEVFRYPPDCPLKPERAGRTRERLHALGLLDGDNRRELAPRPATRTELELFHDPRYLDALERAAAGDLTVAGLHFGLGQPDTPVFADLARYAAWAAGATLTGAEFVRQEPTGIAFNPSGGFHHAGPARAAGFCYVNDVVLGCLRLLQRHRRVACVDLDAHHGDGVQAAFDDRADLLFISLHESGQTLYPGTGFETEIGRGPGEGYTVNVPLPAGTYDEVYLAAFGRVVPPLLGAYQPEAIVVELGMDTLAGDPLTHLSLTNNVLVEILPQLLALDRPLLIVGGGGYHADNTVRAWTLAWQTLGGDAAAADWSFGLGGVMLESTEWAGGLQDRARPPSDEQRQAVVPEVDRVVTAVTRRVFPIHGLQP